MEHFGEKDVLFTTAERKSTGSNFQVCNLRFPIVSVYRLTQAGLKLEVNDATAQLTLSEVALPVWSFGTSDRSFTTQTR